MRLRSGTLPTHATRIPAFRNDPQLQSVPVGIKNVRTRLVTTLMTTGMQFHPDNAFTHEVLIEFAQLMFRLYASLTWLSPATIEKMAIAGNIDRALNCATRTWAMRSDVDFNDPELLREIKNFGAYMVMLLQGGFYTPSVPEPGVEYLRVQCSVLLPSVGGTIDLLLTRRQMVPVQFSVQCALGPRVEPAPPQQPHVVFQPLLNHAELLRQLGVPEQAAMASRAQAAAAALGHNGNHPGFRLPLPPEGEGVGGDADRTSADESPLLAAEGVFADGDGFGEADDTADDDEIDVEEDEGSDESGEEEGNPSSGVSPFPPGVRLGAVPPPNLLHRPPPPPAPGDSF